jgi:hypothetical protein
VEGLAYDVVVFLGHIRNTSFDFGLFPARRKRLNGGQEAQGERKCLCHLEGMKTAQRLQDGPEPRTYIPMCTSQGTLATLLGSQEANALKLPCNQRIQGSGLIAKHFPRAVAQNEW